MKRIAIIGGGISGLTCAYDLELARRRGADIDWHLYESSDRLGGIIETTRIATPEGEYILEGGPDGWVSEKPWARELAIELGLESELIYSNDATRRTYILIDGKLQAIPDRMRMMVPEDVSALDASPLFSASAKKAYADEITRGAQLKAQAPDHDESVADFVRRHFGEEVLNTLAAPLLSGVFGGDVHKLSVRAVMPQFVAMEREHGSLIAALQARAQQRTHAPQPIFTSLRRGVASLIDRLAAELSPDRIHLSSPVTLIAQTPKEYEISYGAKRLGFTGCQFAEHVIIATAADAVRGFLGSHLESQQCASLVPTDASSAVLVAFAWPEDLAQSFTIPQGFGILMPDSGSDEEQLLACTFVDQKFPNRAPKGARIIRAFFGSRSAEALSSLTDDAIAVCALQQLREILGPIPEPSFQTVRRWPRSLPQYEVGHLERIAKLEELVAQTPGLHLLGNSYRGVGIPDLIRDARATARKIIAQL